MEIFGIIGYVVLIILAVIWAVGIRIRLGAVIPTILMGLVFTIFAIAIPIMGISYLYSWVFIAIGYIASFIFVFILDSVPFIKNILIFIGSIYAGIIRVGIPVEKIKRQQIQDTAESVANWEQKNQKQCKSNPLVEYHDYLEKLTEKLLKLNPRLANKNPDEYLNLIDAIHANGYKWDEEKKSFINQKINNVIRTQDLDLLTAKKFKEDHEFWK